MLIPLTLRSRDQLAYEIEHGLVLLTRARPRDDPFAAFGDWPGGADCAAYAPPRGGDDRLRTFPLHRSRHAPAAPGPLRLAHPFGDEEGALIWVVVITSAANRPWPDDVALIEDYAALGLPAPSLIRVAKIATIDAADADGLGRRDQDRLAEVRRRIADRLGEPDGPKR